MDNAQHLHTDHAGDFLDRLARDWGLLIFNEIRQTLSPTEALALTDREIVITGIVAGIDESGALHISHQTISARRPIGTPPQPSPDSTKFINLADTVQFQPIGERDIVDEFINSKTERAKHWIRQLAKDTRRSTIDGDALKAIRLVDLSGIYGAETVPGKPAIHFVGGSTDAAELVPGGTVRWVQRKPSCQEH